MVKVIAPCNRPWEPRGD